MSETELLPCPFCGGEAEYSEHHEDNGGVEVYYREYHYYMVCCDKCHLTFTSTLDKEDVVRRWNTRKSMEQILTRLEEEVTLERMDKMEDRVGKRQTTGFGLGVNASIEIVKEEGGIE